MCRAIASESTKRQTRSTSMAAGSIIDLSTISSGRPPLYPMWSQRRNRASLRLQTTTLFHSFPPSLRRNPSKRRTSLEISMTSVALSSPNPKKLNPQPSKPQPNPNPKTRISLISEVKKCRHKILRRITFLSFKTTWRKSTYVHT